VPSFLTAPFPWYLAGPLIGLFAPLLLWLGNRQFGVSSNLRHMCAIISPQRLRYFAHDWRREGGWNLAFGAGIVIGGFLAGYVFRNPEPITIAAATRDALVALGIHDFSGLMPRELFGWASLATVTGWIVIVAGGFCVGFGTAYAGGCTSGHGISGVADLQVPSFIALAGFFAGGVATTFFLLPLVLGTH
jgi:uncharacterized membrane protein YedE/YeeE